jgi:hypothetical protein
MSVAELLTADLVVQLRAPFGPGVMDIILMPGVDSRAISDGAALTDVRCERCTICN